MIFLCIDQGLRHTPAQRGGPTKPVLLYVLQTSCVVEGSRVFVFTQLVTLQGTRTQTVHTRTAKTLAEVDDNTTITRAKTVYHPKIFYRTRNSHRTMETFEVIPYNAHTAPISAHQALAYPVHQKD